jgi:hypothetical protein
VKLPPVPTCVATSQALLRSCSVQWYDWLATAQRLEGAQLGLWQLPKGVKSEWNKLSSLIEGFNFPAVRSFDVAGNQVYAVELNWQENFWAWLLDTNGKLLAGGSSSAGGPQLTWESPLSAADDLDVCDCSGGSACNFCAP